MIKPAVVFGHVLQATEVLHILLVYLLKGVMPRNRFRKILQILQFVDNSIYNDSDTSRNDLKLHVGFFLYKRLNFRSYWMCLFLYIILSSNFLICVLKI